MATYTFEKWYMYGSGWTTSYWGQATISVSRAYGSDYARVTASNVQMYTYGGDESATWTFWIKINGTWYSWQLSSGWHEAGKTYNYGSHYWDISVGASAGSLTIVTQMDAYDYNNNIHGYSAQKPSSSGESYSYGSKGASTISSATNVTLPTSGSVVSTVKFVSYSSSFRHRFRTYYGGAWGDWSDYIQGQNSQTITVGVSIPASAIDRITTAMSATCTIYLYTYSGSTEIGHSSKAITMTLPSGINPTVDILSVAKSAKVTNSFTKICTILDAVQVNWNYIAWKAVSTNTGSPLDKGVIYVDGVAGDNTDGHYVSGVLANYGSIPAVATASDKRGNTGSDTEYFEVYRYFYPAFSSVKFKTDNSLDIIGSVAYVDGENVPSLTLKIYKGQATTGTTVDLSSYIPTATGGTYDKAYQINFNYPIPSSYIPDIATETYRFEVIVGDSITTSTTTVYSAVAVMTFGAGGTSITAHKPIAFDGVPSSALNNIGWQYVGKTIGNILQAPNEASSYGQAVVFRDVMTGLYRIEFECNIDGTAPSGSSNFTFGLYRDFITNTVGVKIDPISDIGYWQIWDNGANNFNYSGYAPVFQKFTYNTASNKGWRFARVYNTSGGVGGWGNGSMASVAGRHYKGVCYGRHED